MLRSAFVRFAAFALMAVLPPSASAHEIGTTQVRATFRTDRSYVIDVTTAPQALLNRLEVLQGQPRSAAPPRDELVRRLGESSPFFMEHVAIEFDGTRPTSTATVIGGDSAVTMRIVGRIPPRVKTFRWHYALSYSAYPLTLQNEGSAAVARQWLDGEGTSAPFQLAQQIAVPSRLEVFREYLVLGFQHILPRGLDHILFILGLFLLSTRLGPLLRQVTAFTVAHSITLGLTMYGLVALSPRIVEPLIAVSIAYVAIENLTTTELKPWRIPVVFGFGLLHGLGFAGVLRSAGVPPTQFLNALLAFNIGVETGQLTVIAIASIVFAHWWSSKSWYRNWLVVPASFVIACMGIFWTVQRTVGM